MKNKVFYITSTVLLIVATSSLSGSYFYKYAKNESTIEKEAAVKGVEFDLREKLSKEAIDQAEQIIREETSATESPANTQVLTFFKFIEEEKYEDAWGLLSESGKDSLKSVNGLKNLFKNYKSFEVKDTEYRTSSPLSELTAVKLDVVYKTESEKQKNGEKTFYIRSINDNAGWLIDDISES